MLAKHYRLKEREVKKVLRKGKPFFSYTLVLQRFPNRLSRGRFAIVIGAKSVPNNVMRNHYRRIFYTQMQQYSQDISSDIVCVIPKKVRLEKTFDSEQKFIRDLRYIFTTKL